MSHWNITYLQGKHFDNLWDLKEKLIPDLSDDDVAKRYLLRPWEILFSAKGTRNIAALYKEEYGPCVASSTFFVIKVKDNAILPEYLAILLNEAQKGSYFKNSFSWSTVPSIPKSILENFEINIPLIKKQKHIIHIYDLYKQQLKLYDKLLKKKSELINSLILHSHLSS